MAEIYVFDIHKADMRRNADGSRNMRLYYPDNPKPTENRMKENLPFGINVLENMIEQGYSKIADENNPVRPPSGGSFYIFEDGQFICNRRDAGAPTHKLFHEAHAGYPDSKEALYSGEALMETALRESAEECLLITKDKTPWLIVPNDSKEWTMESAKRIGLDLKPRYVDVETMEPKDQIEVYDSKENEIYKVKTNISLIYESQTAICGLWNRKFPFSAEEILPIDAEYFMKDGKPVHINRESYILAPSEIEDKVFGDVLENPRVYKTRIKDGIPTVFTPKYYVPFAGPEDSDVSDPHVWAPDNTLTRSLDSLGMKGYHWVKAELWLEKTKLRGGKLQRRLEDER